MIKKYETKDIKLNTPLAGLATGTVLHIKVDKSGTPKERYWRDRVKDAKIDDCVEFVSETKTDSEVKADLPKKAKAKVKK